MSSDLNALPAVRFISGSAADVESAIITTYEKTAGRSLAKGDPVRLFLESVAAVIIQLRENVDWAAKQNFLLYAEGDYLDHLGALLGVFRLPAQPALVTVRFSLSAAQGFAVLIPKGTRVTPDGTRNFATDQAAVIPAGETQIDVGATCMTKGEAGNGYVPGQVDKLVDPVAYVARVSNTTRSEGGSDVESDASLRERIRLAPEHFSVAGPSGAYEYWAKTAHQGIIDVAVIAPPSEPGAVYVYPLLDGGVIPGQDVLNLVAAACGSEKVRPLTDTVHVVAPSAVSYATNLTYYVANADAVAAAEIQKSVAAAVKSYELWQRSKLGRDVIPSELVRRVMAAGALRVSVTSPAHAVLTASQVAIPSADPVVTFGGLEDG